MNDRVLIPLGNRLLALSREVFDTGLREGAAITPDPVSKTPGTNGDDSFPR
jgi:hypothetical protein